MQKLSALLADRLANGENAVLATVLFHEGSVPRTTGAAMAVFSDTVAGTVGGGAAEHAAIATAREILDTRDCRIQRFDSMCGKEMNVQSHGAITVLLQGLTKADADLYVRAKAFARGKIPMALVRTVQNGQVTAVKLQETGGIDRPTLETLPDGYRLTEPLTLRSHAYLFGAGHVAQQVAPELVRVGFSVTVIDARKELLSLPCFACAFSRILGDPAQEAAKLSLSEHDYAIVMASDHQTDFAVLAELLRQNPTYIGCIGSHKKIEKAKQCLAAKGISEENFSARVRAPIGLPIRAETPEEIAVSIAAEMILHRAERTKGS